MNCRSYKIDKIFIQSILPTQRTFINIKSINDKLKQIFDLKFHKSSTD